MTYDVVTIGSATVDLFADTDSELIRIDTRFTSEALLAFPLGGKILIKELATTTGGGGTNSATAFARLGFATAFLGKLGNDVNGDFVISTLAAENIPFLGARAGQTGVSIVLNSIRDDRTILTHKGSNNLLEKADIPAFATSWIYLASMLEKSWDTVVDFLAGSACKLAFNPSTYQVALGYDRLRVITDRAALLIMNREDACMLLGFDSRQFIPMLALIHAFARIPGQVVAITDGANGAWVRAGDLVLSARPVHGLHVVEATGAGDAFAATLTACQMRGLELAESLHYAMTNAESVLCHRGAKEKLLAWDELQDIARRYPRQIVTHTHGEAAVPHGEIRA